MSESDRIRKMEQEGWDTTVLRAPATPGDHRNSSGKKRQHHHRHRRHRGRRVALIVLLVLLVLVGAAVAAGAWYMGQIGSALSLDEESADVRDVLTDAKPNEAFYVLLLGSDERENRWTEEGAYGRSDVMMLLRVDPVDSLVTMLSVPRDTPYCSASGEWMKINEVFKREGAAASVRAVEGVTGVSISHFAEIRGTGLENLVDHLGGITVDVPIALNFTNIAGDAVHLEPGVQHLDGAGALGVANNRLAYSDQADVSRQEAARLVVQGILDEIKATPATQLPGTIVEAAKCVGTDMSVGEIVDLVTKMNDGIKTYSGTGPFAGCINPWVNDLWLCYVDPTGWQRVMALVDAGEDPSGVSYAGDQVTIAAAPDGGPVVVVSERSGLEDLAKDSEARARAFMAQEASAVQEASVPADDADDAAYAEGGGYGSADAYVDDFETVG